MKDQPFRKPEDMESTEKVPFSCRIKPATKEILEKAAKKKGEKGGWLGGQVLDDYAEWLSKQKR